MLPLQRNGQTNIKVQFPGSPNLPSQALGGIQTVILEKNNPSPNALKIADNPQRVTERMFVHETMEHFFYYFRFRDEGVQCSLATHGEALSWYSNKSRERKLVFLAIIEA